MEKKNFFAVLVVSLILAFDHYHKSVKSGSPKKSIAKQMRFLIRKFSK